MSFSLDVIRARKGDCLILHYGEEDNPRMMLIDGGPSNVYAPFLKPRLDAIREQRDLPDGKPLPIDVLLISHVDDDHIKGILELTTELREQAQSKEPLEFKVGTLWHNSFDDLLKTTPRELKAEAQFGAAALAGEIELDHEEFDVAKVLASIPQGRTLRLDAQFLKWVINKQFDKQLILASKTARPVKLPGGLTLTVVGPMKPELQALQKAHDDWVKKNKQKTTAALAAFIDKSVPNLSSIVLLAEADGKSMLLTGDARGDKILDGLELVGRLRPGESMHVHLLKVPHHGSSNNLETVFFQRVTADHYVFSGDGEHGNPERETLEMLLEARGNEPFTLHFTYDIGQIDDERKRDWEKEQAKEKKRGKKKDIREDWDPKKHSLSAVFDEHPELKEKLRVVEPGKAHLIVAGSPPATAAVAPRSRRNGRGATAALASVTTDETAPLSIPRDLVDFLLLGSTEDHRQLQDSPILGDVWLAFASEPSGAHDLLITPHRETTAGRVARAIAKGIKEVGRTTLKQADAPDIAYLQGLVAARLRFREVLRVVMPLTMWWRDQRIVQSLMQDEAPELIKGSIHKLLASFRARLPHQSPRRAEGGSEHVDSLQRYIALAALILWAAEPPKRSVRGAAADVLDIVDRFEESFDQVIQELVALLESIRRDWKDGWGAEYDGKQKRLPAIFQVSMNRRPMTAMEKSIPAVKADAARTLFSVDCSRITWGILDSGIDGAHDAFRGHDGNSRVRRTFDFTRIRDILSFDDFQGVAAANRLKSLIDGTQLQSNPKEARTLLERLQADAEEERPLNWGLIERFVRLEKPPAPPNIHGTHVAGILGAKEVGDNPRGMCPDIQLYDFRVLAKTMEDTEFAVIAALQYIRYINELHNHITIHGVNLSLSIPHNVRNYACGRTPICNECERMIENGVVVVAAAGNRGYQSFETKDGTFENYAAFSITDPGNTESVITVGSTHRNWPHTYGVSFYSSRGPTGDGRLKPDLVAPGERIQAPTRNGEWGLESGTSMAAPHVSGAAAMLLARYVELIGQPRRVKRILCESATDLGRERTFQGNGMLDVLRAFQSI